MELKEAVWEKCRKIPKGNVSTYKEIAHALGTNAYRAVGTALKHNPYDPDSVPCHRVVSSDGHLGGYGGKMNSPKKVNLLKKEGVIVKEGKIKEFEKKLFKF